MRQIILDTETTGLKPEEGHRIIEIGCLEMIDRKLTGKSFHHYLNPKRDIEAGATAVHGITNEFLQDKLFFEDIAEEFILFIEDAELIIHNAPFDVGFLNHELSLANQEWKRLEDYCSIVDTLPMARKRHIGQRNSLDALCKRYNVDLSKRDFHGALLDASLLAQVYLAMTGGQGSFFDAAEETSHQTHQHADTKETINTKHKQLFVLAADETEITTHQQYLEAMKKKGQCVWLDDKS